MLFRSVEAVEYVKLAFRVSGQIISLPVIEGEKVKKGQLIAAIDPRDIALQYAATKSAYETASAQVERNKRLLSRQAISVQEYEISLSNYQKAKSEYELSSNNMRDTKLTAPFDGSIEKRLVENYQRVNSGEGIVQLVNTQNLRIKFTIPDAYLYLLRAKDPRFLVEFDTFKGHVFKARLEEYLDISTEGTGIPVSITIDDPSFDRDLYAVKPGFTCSIRFTADVGPLVQDSWTIIPLSAVFGESDGNNMYVWVVEDNKVHKRKIVVNAPTGEAQVLVSEGLKPGEQIVIAGVYQLVEGESIKSIAETDAVFILLQLAQKALVLARAGGEQLPLRQAAPVAVERKKLRVARKGALRSLEVDVPLAAAQAARHGIEFPVLAGKVLTRLHAAGDRVTVRVKIRNFVHNSPQNASSRYSMRVAAALCAVSV